jgi:hypothetical protein
MRRVLYVLVGFVLFAGAIGMFGARQWDEPQHRRHDPGHHRLLERSHDAQPYTVFDYWEGRRSDRGQTWFNAKNVLDMLNVLVGLAGIALTLNGMRTGRNTMQMSMRGRG